MEDQCRCLDRRQHVANIDLVVGPHQGQNGSRTRRGPLQSAEPLNERRVILAARRVDRDEHALTPVGLQPEKEVVPLLAVEGPRFPLDAGEAAAQHESRGALRIGSGEHQRHRPALRPAADRGAAGADRVHHRTDIADALLEGLLGHAIGEPLTPLVEDDDAREGHEPLQQILVDGELPVEIGMGQRSRDEHEIAGTIAKHAVGDVDISAPGVSDVAPHGRFPRSGRTSAARGSSSHGRTVPERDARR